MDRVETNVATNLFFFVFLFIKGGGILHDLLPWTAHLRTYVTTSKITQDSEGFFF